MSEFKHCHQGDMSGLYLHLRWASRIKEQVASHLPMDASESLELGAGKATKQLTELNLAAAQLILSVLPALGHQV